MRSFFLGLEGSRCVSVRIWETGAWLEDRVREEGGSIANFRYAGTATWKSNAVKSESTVDVVSIWGLYSRFINLMLFQIHLKVMHQSIVAYKSMMPWSEYLQLPKPSSIVELATMLPPFFQASSSTHSDHAMTIHYSDAVKLEGQRRRG